MRKWIAGLTVLAASGARKNLSMTRSDRGKALREGLEACAVCLALMTGAATAAEISPVTVYSYSSQLSGREAIKSCNGSGLNASWEHDTATGNMWLSNGADQSPVIVYNLGGNFMVTNILVWNYNEVNYTGRGIRNVDILGSTDAGNYTLITNITLNYAPGTANYACNNAISNITPVARYIKLVTKSGGSGGFGGLSEIKFFGEPVTLLALNTPAASGITTNSASVSVNLADTGDGNADVTVYWKAGAPPTTPYGHTGWDGSNGPASASEGLVERAISGLLNPDTQYTFVWYATNSYNQQQAWSTPVTVITDLAPAQKPVFTNAVVAWDTVRLDWQDNAANETGYLLQRSTAGADGPYTVIRTLPANTKSVMDYFVPAGTVYYRLAATNSLSGGSATLFEQCQTNVTPVSPGSIIAIDPAAGVTVSSYLNDVPRIGANVVNGSGLNTNTWWHGADAAYTWLSSGTYANQWIAFDLGDIYTINRFHVWNYIEAAGYANRGVDGVTISYGKTEALGSTVAGISSFAASSTGGTWGQAFTAFTPFKARYIRFAVGNRDYVGLSEVRFLGNRVLAGTIITIR